MLMSRAIAVASCVFVTAASLALRGQTQGQEPTFKAGVQLVRIDVSVLDDKRQPVRGLQASDFTVFEDGQSRPIRSFQAVDVASATATATPSMAPIPDHEVATNRSGNDTSRLIFILMDRSIPPERPMIVARQIADAAVDAMAPGDLAAILTTGISGTPQNLTSDRARLHKTIASADWSQGLSQAQKDVPSVAALDMADTLGDTRCMCGLCVMDTITRIANEVRAVPRRKVMLFIGNSIIVQAGPRGASQDVGCEKRVRDSREKLFDALGAANMTVHSIDPNGVATVGPASRATVVNGVENRDGRVLNNQLMQERSEFMAAQGSLAVLPDLTGGRTILNNNEPFRLVPDVLHESDAYYLLAFDPIESVGEIRHTIDVKVARKGVAVHTTRFILPPAGRAPANGANATDSPLDRALTDILPNQSVPLGMSIASFAGPDAGHGYVGVTLDASAFADKPGSTPLEIAVLASDARGKTAGGARQTGTVEVPLGAAGGPAGSVELQTYLTLPPGEYELRAAVMNAESRAASSVFTHVTIPSFEDGRLGLSDVVIGTRENTGSLPEGAPAMPIVPTTARTFKPGEPAWAFLRVYRPVAAGSQQPVSVETTVLDSDGNQVRHQTLQSATFTGRYADVRIGLPLKNLASGSYVLRIDAKQGRAESSRTIGFIVAQTAASIAQEHSPELDAALAATAAYLDGYERRISAVGAEETYEQGVSTPGSLSVRPVGRGSPTAPVSAPLTSSRRKTRANIMTISLGPRGWVSFRDVFELDGRPVRPDIERLSRILQNVNPDSLAQARQIADESAKYNLNPEGTHFDRTINVPMTALHFLRASNQPRSVFSLGKPERVGGILCTTLQFTEQSRPRLIGTKDDAAAQGRVWLDMANGGRVVKTELRMQSAFAAGQSVRAETTVTYGQVDKLDLWLPIVMDETYDLPTTRQTVTGHATYAGFKEFKVTTASDIKDIK
jgi:VWFA-related protein